MPRGVDHLSRRTHARFRGPRGYTSCPEHFGPVSEGPRSRPLSLATQARVQGPKGSTSSPNDSCPAAIACGFEKLSRATQANVRGPTQTTNCPGRLRLRSEVLRNGRALLGDSRLGLWARGVDQQSRRTRARVEGPWGRPAVPRHLGRCPRARGVEQLSRAILAGVRWRAGSTSCPR